MEIGLAASAYLLDINRSLAVPHDFALTYPWNLASRLFQFPIEISAAEGDGARRIGLMHPMHAAHPFVQHVEATLGVTLASNGAPNACGVSTAHTGQWWHAMDLVSAGQWRALLDTREYTKAEDIARAVAYGLTDPAMAENPPATSPRWRRAPSWPRSTLPSLPADAACWHSAPHAPASPTQAQFIGPSTTLPCLPMMSDGH